MSGLARAPLRETGWRDGLARLRAYLGCTAAALLHVDRATNRLRLRTCGALPEAERLYVAICAEAADADPRAAHACHAPQDVIWTEREVAAEARKAARDLYRRILTPHGADFMRAVVLARRGEEQIVLATAEPAAEAASDTDANERLAAVLPHVRAGLEIEQALQREGRFKAAEVAAGLGAPALILAADGRVLDVTGAAARRLAGDAELGLVHGRLTARSPDLARGLEQAVRRAGVAGAPRESVVRTDGLALRVVPLPGAPRMALGEQAAIAVLLGADGGGDRLRALAAKAQLTPAETDIVGMLVEGLSADEIAERRQAARETVRTQLKSIYVKTGSASRAHLLRAFYDAAVDDEG